MQIHGYFSEVLNLEKLIKPRKAIANKKYKDKLSKKMKHKAILLILIINFHAFTQQKAKITPIGPIPTAQQMAWHKLETYAFIHFTTNTFTDKEWGFGDESPAIFNPTDFDAEQWVKIIKETGLKAVILTCKHHDGFVLWPSKYTKHSVAASPWQNGKGDVVKELSMACKKYGLKFGVYLSPWDRNRADYGQTSYIDYYRLQLKELFENYGPIFEMWFDGANGGDGYYGGANEKRKINGRNYYDWPGTIDLVRKMEPNILFFSDAGPEIRWVGNERGVAGTTNWNTITIDTLFAGKAGIEELLNTGHENGKHWVPAEVDVSIRPGWFYHASEDTKVKTVKQLFDIYLSSVGRGSNLLLNIPPDRRGKINEIDAARLKAWRDTLNQVFGNNLAKKAKIKTSKSMAGYGNAKVLNDGNNQNFWAAATAQNSTIELNWSKTQSINYIEIGEAIDYGQRVKAFEIEYFTNNNWQKISQGTTIGYKRIVTIPNTETQKIRIKFLDAKGPVLINEVRVF